VDLDRRRAKATTHDRHRQIDERVSDGRSAGGHADHLTIALNGIPDTNGKHRWAGITGARFARACVAPIGYHDDCGHRTPTIAIPDGLKRSGQIASASVGFQVRRIAGRELLAECQEIDIKAVGQRRQ
jgi:hypothetical protein